MVKRNQLSYPAIKVHQQKYSIKRYFTVLKLGKLALTIPEL
jgi:hypothetical protein